MCCIQCIGVIFANWNALNSSLNSTDWDIELQGDVQEAWCSFKRILFTLMDQHIPKIEIGGVSQPSWFDAETHQLCREKERLHQKYKGTVDPNLNLSRYIKFSWLRKNSRILSPIKWATVLRMKTILVL